MSLIQKTKALLGFKEYLVEIRWDNGEKEIVPTKAWGPMNAIRKVEKTKDVANKADMTILNHSRYSKVRYIKDESLGIARKK
ncbi:hypothetical protein ACLIA0_15015 [Bacillaceae bacterium W0354]